MSPTKKEQSAATTAHVLDVAESMFAEAGFAGVGLEDVASRAGVTRGALYHHFRSKNGLFEAVLDRVAASVADTVADAASSEKDPWQQLVDGCHAFVDAACSDRNRRILLVDGPSVLGWTVWRRTDERHSGRLLREGLAPFTGGDEATAVMVSGAMNEAALWLARPDAAETDRDRTHGVLDAMLTTFKTQS